MKTLYVVHGWTYTVEPWEKTITLLEKNGIKVKMLSVPGLTSPSDKVWKIKDYVKWADENIPDGAIALGHSNGGRILLNLLSEKPDKLKHVILLDAAGVYEESKKRDIARKASKLLSPLKKIKPLRKVVHKVLGASDYSHAPENMKKTLTTLTCFSLYNALTERESADSLFSDLTPVIFFNSPTRWPVVVVVLLSAGLTQAR